MARTQPLPYVPAMFASGMYGSIVSVVFVFFYNLWPSVASLISGRKIVTR